MWTRGREGCRRRGAHARDACAVAGLSNVRRSDAPTRRSSACVHAALRVVPADGPAATDSERLLPSGLLTRVALVVDPVGTAASLTPPPVAAAGENGQVDRRLVCRRRATGGGDQVERQLGRDGSSDAAAAAGAVMANKSPTLPVLSVADVAPFVAAVGGGSPRTAASAVDGGGGRTPLADRRRPC